MKKIYFFNFLLISFTACVSAPDYPVEPVLTFISQSTFEMVQDAANTDSVFITIGFTDGDGDIGLETGENDQNIFLIDTRSGVIQDRFKTPAIPPEGSNNGVSGEIRMLVYTTCCQFPDGIPPCESPPQYPTDTLSYEIYMVDRAGNVSNTVETNLIVLRCD